MNPKPWYATLLRPAAVIAGVAVCSKLFQAGGGILLAHKFGACRATDAYLLAKSLPIGLYLVADSLLYNSVVPVYRRHQHPDHVLRDFLGGVSVVCGLLAVAIVAALAVAAPAIMRYLAPGSAPETIRLAGALCRLTCLGVLTALPASLLKSVNACHDRYVLASLDSFVMSAVLIAVLLASPARWGIWPVAGALPVSCAILFTIQLVAARREVPRPRASWRNPLLAELAGLVAPLIAFNGLHQVNVIAMNAFMSRVGDGAISWLNYSYNIGQIPVSLIDLVLLSTLFPFAAALASNQDTDTVRRAFQAVAKLVVLALVPASLWVILMRRELVQLILEHGEFGVEATQGTTACLIGIGLAITPWALDTLAYRCLFALKRHGAYARIVAARVALNVGLCALLVGRYGAMGVGFAFGASFVLGAALSARAIGRALPGPAPLARPWCLGSVALAFLGAAAVATAHMAIERIVRGAGEGQSALSLLAWNASAACFAVALVYGAGALTAGRRKTPRTGLEA
ncbi:MAG: oligosaccharide flippase family protein [Candidatus Hydrogenedentes bacterium]|nr:oligosaccharide flippase family protein [Candidatus Hydrogenedentota bacterium]